MSGVWVKVHPDQVGGGSGTLDPAELLSDPVAVANATAPGSYTVKLTDGSQKKIWFLPGNTSGFDLAVYSVQMTPGTLPGIMVAAGGPGGGLSGAATFRAGAGGAGGVIGMTCRVPVILPSAENETYTIKVPPTAIGGDWNLSGQSCSISITGQEPFMAAVGGGVGCKMNSSTWPAIASVGGSGGGGSSYVTTEAYGVGAAGVPGQGHKGGDGSTAGTTYGGGGGGYGSPGDHQLGGEGFNLADALMLDASDGSTKLLLDLVTDEGWIASGGQTIGTPPLGGGGVGSGSNAKNFTGSGGGGDTGVGGAGAAGMVLLVTEV